MRYTLYSLAGAAALVFLFTFGAERAETAIVPATFESAPSISIDNKGHAVINGLRVQQIAGGTFFTRIYWGELFMRITVRTTPTTNMTKKFGGVISASEIKVGDIISVEGDILYSSDRMDITATTLKNWTDQTDNSNFSGTIINLSPLTFRTVAGTTHGLGFATSSVIHKGTITIGSAALRVNDKITYAKGVYDHAAQKLIALDMRVHQDMSLFATQNFQGTLKEIGSDFLIVSIGGTDYTVRYGLDTTLLTAARTATTLQRFVVGDTVRIYGARREVEPSVITAQIIRNLNL